MGQKRKREEEEESKFKVLSDGSDPTYVTIEELSYKPGHNSGDKSGMKRCFECRRKVGLLGFICRCGDMFCWEHRYSDRHDCAFDYKAAGRVAIAKENPVIRPAKILKV